jgi:hypothetical protein
MSDYEGITGCLYVMGALAGAALGGAGGHEIIQANMENPTAAAEFVGVAAGVIVGIPVGGIAASLSGLILGAMVSAPAEVIRDIRNSSKRSYNYSSGLSRADRRFERQTAQDVIDDFECMGRFQGVYSKLENVLMEEDLTGLDKTFSDFETPTHTIETKYGEINLYGCQDDEVAVESVTDFEKEDFLNWRQKRAGRKIAKQLSGIEFEDSKIYGRCVFKGELEIGSEEEVAELSMKVNYAQDVYQNYLAGKRKAKLSKEELQKFENPVEPGLYA